MTRITQKFTLLIVKGDGDYYICSYIPFLTICVAVDYSFNLGVVSKSVIWE